MSVGDLSKQVSDKIRGLKALTKKIDEMRLYLEDVIGGKLPMNSDIVHNLQEIFNLLPNLNYDEIIKSFNVKTNDLMHMTYVASLIRATISLHNLINNKLVYNSDLEKDFNAKEEAKKPAPAVPEKKDQMKEGN